DDTSIFSAVLYQLSYLGACTGATITCLFTNVNSSAATKNKIPIPPICLTGSGHLLLCFTMFHCVSLSYALLYTTMHGWLCAVYVQVLIGACMVNYFVRGKEEARLYDEWWTEDSAIF
ncbi:MAG TPA: hypothetical protein VFU49_23685, partial [Ktedonobacteraceae bacterium]|nr:hypothetical protein [Ktedonobacteraceae bacterium]